LGCYLSRTHCVRQAVGFFWSLSFPRPDLFFFAQRTRCRQVFVGNASTPHEFFGLAFSSSWLLSESCLLTSVAAPLAHASLRGLVDARRSGPLYLPDSRAARLSPPARVLILLPPQVTPSPVPWFVPGLFPGSDSESHPFPGTSRLAST